MIAQHTEQQTTTMPQSTTNHAAYDDWRYAAIAAYRGVDPQDVGGLLAELSARVFTLVGRSIAPEMITIDRAQRTATARVDTILFEVRHHDLVIIQPCVSCRIRQIASPVIAGRADLGYVLTDWEPRCMHCLPEDDEDWSHSF